MDNTLVEKKPNQMVGTYVFSYVYTYILKNHDRNCLGNEYIITRIKTQR